MIDQRIDQHKTRDRWVMLGLIGKTAGIKKTLEALFVKVFRGV